MITHRQKKNKKNSQKGTQINENIGMTTISENVHASGSLGALFSLRLLARFARKAQIVHSTRKSNNIEKQTKHAHNKRNDTENIQ